MSKNLLVARVGLLVGALGTLGCGGDSASNLYTQFSNAEADAVATLCGCSEALGFDSRAACTAEFIDENTAVEEACVTDVYAMYQAEAAESARCDIAVIRDAQRCVNDVVACDEDAVSACLDAAGEAFDECPPLPTLVEDALDACFPAPDLYGQLTSSEDEAIAVLCECFEAVGAASEAECIAEFSDDDTSAERACLTEVYMTYGEEALAATQCEISVFDDAQACVNAVSACDPTAVDACFQAAETAGDACPQLPLVVEDAIDDCYN